MPGRGRLLGGRVGRRGVPVVIEVAERIDGGAPALELREGYTDSRQVTRTRDERKLRGETDTRDSTRDRNVGNVGV